VWISSPFGKSTSTAVRVRRWQVFQTAVGKSRTGPGSYFDRVSGVVVRRARTSDVRAMKALIDQYAGKVLLAKPLVTLYEDVQEFWVADEDGELLGCGALHVLWEDLAEIRSVAVSPLALGRGIGHLVVAKLVDVARELQLSRIFVLTFETRFFGKHGFVEIDGTPVSPEVYEEIMRSVDEGVAEFLDLSYVKPNTLGNSRMLLQL
jgi:amino-acid N-acetyltransferase